MVLVFEILDENIMVPLMKYVLSADILRSIKLDHHNFQSCMLRVMGCCKRANTPAAKHNGEIIPDNMSVLMGDSVPLPEVTNIMHLFEESLQNGPLSASCGLYINNEFMHYTELNQKAEHLAVTLNELVQSHLLNSSNSASQATRQPVFAVDISPSFELIIAIVSILKVNGVFLPVDSLLAINRVKNTLNECQPQCVIVDSDSVFLRDTDDKIWSNFIIYNISKMTWETKCGKDLNRTVSRRDSIAAILYTSGSTGVPKGVQLSHQAILNRLMFQWTHFPFDSNEVGCFKTSVLFVDSIVEIFSCLLKLVPLVIVPKSFLTNPENFVGLMEQRRVTRLTLVPSLLRCLLFYLMVSDNHSNRLRHLYLWISNSEKLTIDLLIKFFEVFPGRKMFNLYGSTETMADVTLEVYENETDIETKQKDKNLSIGRPLANNNVYILNDKGFLLPRGQIGEICVSGKNITPQQPNTSSPATGYRINDVIVDDQAHSLVYHTGDYGRIVNNMLIFEDRRDMQVKIAGQRVNISEIEKVIMECPGVKQAVVLCHKFTDVSTVLVAYFVLVKGFFRTSTQNLITDACREILPPYMRPKLLNVREIPLQTYTGKVDRNRLKKLYERAFKRQSTLDLLTFDEKSQKVLNIIGMNLNIPPNAIPQKVSFSELGGNSITMMSTIIQLKQYNLHIPIEMFTESCTVQDIINLVKESSYDHIYQEPLPVGYSVKYLNDVPNSEETVHLLADSFIIKDPLEVLLGEFHITLYAFILNPLQNKIVLVAKLYEVFRN